MTFVQNVRRIVALAWPVLIGQIAVIAFGVLDTAMVARFSPDDVAALAVGGALYISLFVGLMGTLNAVGPIVGQLFGARRMQEAGVALKQALWLAGLLACAGSATLLLPGPWIALTHASPLLADRIAGYLFWLAFALPPALGFAAIRAFNNAVSRPKAIMAVQVGGLALKVPLNLLFIFGAQFGPFDIDPRGSPGCALATACVMWCDFAAGLLLLAFDKFYAHFEVFKHGIGRPIWARQQQLLKLGIPMGMSYLVEVTAFTFMAIFIARLGSVPVSGHQIVSNLVTVMFMMPLALAVATSTLVAQNIGVGDRTAARRVGWHGVRLAATCAVVLASVVWIARDAIVRGYTHDTRIAAAALPLVGWVVLFHVADTIQTLAAFVLRAYKVALVPTLVYAVSLWGVGMGGGYWLVFVGGPHTPPWLQGARGFWFASMVGFAIAAIALSIVLDRTTRVRKAGEDHDAHGKNGARDPLVETHARSPLRQVRSGRRKCVR